MYFTHLARFFGQRTRLVLAVLVPLAITTPVVQAQSCPAINGLGGIPHGAPGGMPITDMLGCGGLWLGNSGMHCHTNPQAAACPTIRVKALTLRDQLQIDAEVPSMPNGGKPNDKKECPMLAQGTYPACKCPNGERYDSTNKTCKAAGALNSAAATRQDQQRMDMIMGILLLNEHYKLGLDIKANPSPAKRK